MENNILQKLQFPLESTNMTLQVKGVYNFPDEWNNYDQNLFQYECKLFGIDILDGKLNPRQKTEKEQKEEEEALLAKKAPKTKKKKGEEEVIISPEEEMRLKKQKEKEEEEARIAQEEWDKLSQSTQLHLVSEDIYKKPCIKFVENTSNADKQGESLVTLEERVHKDSGDFIYFNKIPNGTEEELVKLRKKVPKGLPPGELYPVVSRGWCDFSQLKENNATQIELRIFLEQDVQEEYQELVTQYEFPQMYVHIVLSLTNPVVSIPETIITSTDIVPKASPPEKLEPSIQCIDDFNEDIILALQSLAIEYCQIFPKDLQIIQEHRNKSMLAQPKKIDIQKRKEQFLYDFNVSGKYKVLKERLKKAIVKICRDKFEKQDSITGITTDQADQFYSELYIFLMDQTRQTLQKLIFQKREELNEDIITAEEQTQKQTDKYIISATGETEVQKIKRLAIEYEYLNQITQAEQNFKNLVKIYVRDAECHFLQGLFLLRQTGQGKDKKDKEKSEVFFQKAENCIFNALTLDDTNVEYIQLMANLYINKGKYKEGFVLLNQILQDDVENIYYNLNMMILFEVFIKNENLTQKYKYIIERLILRTNQSIPKEGNHQIAPSVFELPPILGKAVQERQGPTLTPEEWDDIYLQFCTYLSQFNLYNLIEDILQKLSSKESLQVQILSIETHKYLKEYDLAQKLIAQVLQDNWRNYQVLKLKADICYLNGKYIYIKDQMDIAEETLLKIIKLQGPETTDEIYMKLGTIFLQKKQYGNSQAIFTKAVEINASSSLSWQGLGIACLRAHNYAYADKALAQANIYDPLNGETWAYLSVLCLQQQKFAKANQTIRELFKTEIYNLELLEEIGDLMAEAYPESSEQIYSKILDIADRNKINVKDIGGLYYKIAKTMFDQKKYQIALACFQDAKASGADEDTQEQIQQYIQQIQHLDNA